MTKQELKTHFTNSLSKNLVEIFPPIVWELLDETVESEYDSNSKLRNNISISIPPKVLLRMQETFLLRIKVFNKLTSELRKQFTGDITINYRNIETPII